MVAATILKRGQPRVNYTRYFLNSYKLLRYTQSYLSSAYDTPAIDLTSPPALIFLIPTQALCVA